LGIRIRKNKPIKDTFYPTNILLDKGIIIRE